jgi:hypothetical protein
MSGLAKTTVYADSLGTATWEYSSKNNDAFGNFSASGVAKNKLEPFDLKYIHIFFSKKLSDKQNSQLIENLASTLKSINATDISAKVVNVTSVSQQIDASYTIPQVEPEKVDSLSTTIASVCEGLIEKLSVTVPEESVTAIPSVEKTSEKQKSYGLVNDYIISICENIINQLKNIN